MSGDVRPPALMIRVVAGVILDARDGVGEILVARRSRPSALAGRWELPGGKVEAGESAIAALRRELAEELQIDVAVNDELVGPGGDGWPISEDAALRTWFVHIVGGTPTLTEGHDEIRWVPVSELGHLTWLDADRPVVEAVRALLEKHRPRTGPEHP